MRPVLPGCTETPSTQPISYHSSQHPRAIFIMGSVGKLSDPQEYQKIFHWAETQKDGTIPSFATRRNDPYEVRLSLSRLYTIPS